jgi:hypothetical protein
MTPVVLLEPRISSRIFEKIQMAVMLFSVDWGKLIHEKNQKAKISGTVPLISIDVIEGWERNSLQTM